MSSSIDFIKTKYGLSISAFDAFTEKVAKPDHLIWWANRTEELAKWKSLIEKATQTKKNYLSWIVGSYGRGKTLSLLKIVKEAEYHPNVLSIFINLKSEEKSAPGIDLLFRILKKIDFPALAKQRTPLEVLHFIDSLPKSLQDVKNTLRAIYIGSSNANQISMFSDIGVLSKGHSISEAALNFIRGYSISTTQLKEIGVSKKIDDIDTAKDYLLGILILMKKLNFKSLIIAVDEVESLFSLVGKGSQGTYLALLRSLYDFPMGTSENNVEITNMVFYMGISEAGWSSLNDLKNKEEKIGGPIVPLLERSDEQTFLPVFTKEQTFELIERRLKFNRSDEKFEEQPLIPFTDDFVEFVHNHTNGEPRQILVACGQVLDLGIAEKITALDRKFAEKVLKERGLI